MNTTYVNSISIWYNLTMLLSNQTWLLVNCIQHICKCITGYMLLVCMWSNGINQIPWPSSHNRFQSTIFLQSAWPTYYGRGASAWCILTVRMCIFLLFLCLETHTRILVAVANENHALHMFITFCVCSVIFYTTVILMIVDCVLAIILCGHALCFFCHFYTVPYLFHFHTFLQQ